MLTLFLNRTNYISNKNVIVDKDENIDDHINRVSGVRFMHLKQFERKYKFSMLLYFHDVMNI